MRHATAIAVTVLGLLLVSPRPAEAQGFWRWLESLSGPGPFKDVFGIEVSPVCFADRESWKGLFCSQEPGRNPKVSIVFDVAWGTGVNELGYAPDDVPRGVPDTSLFLFSGGPMWHHESGAVDIGAVVGMMRLSGLPVVESFVTPTLEPRIAVRPLVLADRNNEKLRFLEIRYSPLIVFGGFSLADFGATSGDLNGKPETVHSMQILINAAAFFR